MSLPELPVGAVLPALLGALAVQPAAVLVAPAGSGKSTLTPLALLDQPWLAGRKILLLEPRRLAARAVAARMAALLDEPLGERVGYQIRFERCSGPRTRIEVVTEGMLTRRLQADPELTGVGLLIFDEFHERSLQADLALALALDVQAGLRPDLRLLVMSATLDAAAVAGLLDGAPVVQGEGRSHPVAVHWARTTPPRPDPAGAAALIGEVLGRPGGDLLVFCPGVAEIRALAAALTRQLLPGVEVCPLYGELDSAAQDAALRPRPDRRRVVLATDIAETSLTIEGVTTVVDLGWCRQPRFDPGRGVSRLTSVRVSRASAEQRAGRAGRLGPGVCYRMWREQDHAALAAQRPAEILRADLAPLVLELAGWGVGSPDQLRWLDPPPSAAWAQARDLLVELGALHADGSLSAAGRRLAVLGLHPRLGQLLCLGAARGQSALAADLAALLAEGDPLRPTPGQPRPVDLALRLQALADWRRGARDGLRGRGLDVQLLRAVDRAAVQLRRRVQAASGAAIGLSPGALLALAYPDRIARRRAPGPAGGGRYQLASGRGVWLAEDDPLATQAWIVVAQLDAGQREGRIMLAAALDPAEIPMVQAGRIVCAARLDWDPRRAAVTALEEERLGALVLRARPLEAPDPDALRSVLCEGIRGLGLTALPWGAEADGLRQRVMACRAWQPGEDWPDWSDAALLATLEDWLGPWLQGLRRLDEVRRLDLAAILRGALDWSRQQALDTLAPARLAVPGGRQHVLDYSDPEAPVLAVRLQALFGLTRTPTVNQGRTPVMLHLLSPAGRPVQVTRDLAGFWERGYPQVRKDLRGRYPRHPWPEDPAQALPAAGARPRRR